MDIRTDIASAFRALSQEIERTFPADSGYGKILQTALHSLGKTLDEPAAALSGLDGLEDTLTALLLAGGASDWGTRGASDA